MTHTFQVDLRGMVDLLARHLYSGPRVYVRELLQNAVDAVTARQLIDPAAPATVRLTVHPGEGGTRPALEVVDTGVGLTAEETRELLATIGRSSKRDADLGLGRGEYIGQFGIGMLAAFMVAETIEVVTRSAREGSAVVTWRGHDDGTFEVSETPDPDGATPVGTRVVLRARPDAEHWFSHETVTALAREYGSLLPLDVAIAVPVGGELLWSRIGDGEPPWLRTYPSEAARREALATYCERTLGFTPLGHIDLAVPLTGLTGVAFLLPAAAPGSAGHRVHLKRMLVGTRVEGLLPEWAFFVRAVVDATELHPTASREQLHTDEVLVATQEALAAQLRAWASATLTGGGALARRFVETHHLALRALALTDPEMLELVAGVLPYETTDGGASLAQVRERTGEVLFTGTTEAFRRVAPVARAQNLVVVNAGYVYDADLLRLLGARPGWRVRELAAGDLEAVLVPLAPVRELEVMDAVAAAGEVLADADCEVLVRTYAPAEVPAMLLRDRDGEHQRDLRREAEAADDVWGAVLETFATPARSRRLVLNDASPLVRDLLAAPPGDVSAAGVRSLYLAAVMLAGDGLRPREVEQLNDSLGALLRAGLTGGRTSAEDDA
ncbi:HSP90 family protein [Litorihabitans aurantiacus]|uniref:Molecular chaperone HtpG n=1 Tax=Litorihabitans aurantiacus TaxID=1930061 RepID=A0AA37UPY8_9MICO|nr:HSP90 family protein [Litorihabitans aurantiacus]GMA30668.1 molecular chaperone HtpG [Litorihabitans aurantiacus]